MANPPPGLNSLSSSPSLLNGARNVKTVSTAIEYGSSSKMGEPRWKWIPTRSRLCAASACLIALSASPVSMEKPNLLSSMPVVVFAWVCGSIPGESLSMTVLGRPVRLGYGVQHAELVEAVDDDAAYSSVDGHLQLLRALVVSVEVDVRHGDPGRLGDRQLAARHDVQSQPLLTDQPGQGRVDVCLGRVQHLCIRIARREFVHELPAHAAQRGLVEYVQGGPELPGQGLHVASPEREVAAIRYGGGRREISQRSKMTSKSLLRVVRVILSSRQKWPRDGAGLVAVQS